MDRRNFLAGTMTSGVMAATTSSIAASAGAAELSPRDMRKATIPTPARVVALDAWDANLEMLAEHCRQAKIGFRAHAKSHKCPAIAQRQRAAGARGICVASVPEAEPLAAAGIRGI